MLTNSIAAPLKPGVNPADPRVKRTRKLLQDALLELLTEKSFDAISVQDVAARATVNRATFYAHFADKFDLFGQFSRDWIRTALHRRVPPDATANATNLRLLILATMEALVELADHCRPTESLKPLIMSTVQEELYALLEGWLAADAPTLEDHAVFETTTVSLSWAVFGAALTWSQAAVRPDAEATAAQIADLLSAGLSGVRSQP